MYRLLLFILSALVLLRLVGMYASCEKLPPELSKFPIFPPVVNLKKVETLLLPIKLVIMGV